MRAGRYDRIGPLSVEGDTSRRLSLWADRLADERAIWDAFLKDIAGAGPGIVLNHYGCYDASFLRRMATWYGGGPPEICADGSVSRKSVGSAPLFSAP